MRKSLILGPVVAAALTAGGLAGVAQAGSGSGANDTPDPAAVPTTTVPGGMSLEEILSILTPQQIECLVQNMGSADPNSLDLDATFALLQQCGISLDQLTGGAPATTVAAIPGPTAVAGPDLGALDPATVSAIFTMLGLDASDLACIRAAVAPGVVSDDVGALTILKNCGLTLVALLDGLAQFGGGGPVATATPAPPTVPAGTAASGTTDMMTQLFIDTFASMGLTLTPEQASCLATQATSGIDTSDRAALMALLQSCGIDISQLLGG